MAGFRTVGAIADAYAEGRTHFCAFRKVLGAPGSVATWWFDMSTLSGNPLPNYYIGNPLDAKGFVAERGIWHGPSQAPATKYLHTLELTTSGTHIIGTPYKLCDYLLFYPFVDADTIDEQLFDNTTAELTRYTDGAGVQVMAVLAAPPAGSVGSFTFDYVNQDGVVRTSPVQSTGAGLGNTGNIYPSVSYGPFLFLAAGDTGVRSIISVTFATPPGGLLNMVLVKPLVDLSARELNNPVEFVGGRDRPLIEIADGAYLNLIFRTTGTATSATLTGTANFIWSD
jgi:hypothetical protein